MTKIYSTDVIFSHFVTDEASNDSDKESIRSKCLQYLDKAEQLKRSLGGQPNKAQLVLHGGMPNQKKLVEVIIFQLLVYRLTDNLSLSLTLKPSVSLLTFSGFLFFRILYPSYLTILSLTTMNVYISMCLTIFVY